MREIKLHGGELKEHETSETELPALPGDLLPGGSVLVRAGFRVLLPGLYGCAHSVLGDHGRGVQPSDMSAVWSG